MQSHIANNLLFQVKFTQFSVRLTFLRSLHVVQKANFKTSATGRSHVAKPLFFQQGLAKRRNEAGVGEALRAIPI